VLTCQGLATIIKVFPCNGHLGTLVLTSGYLCADHNVIAFRYFAADEAQSLDGAIFRKEEGAIDGVSFFISRYPSALCD
jgi:hypothetical protein